MKKEDLVYLMKRYNKKFVKVVSEKTYDFCSIGHVDDLIYFNVTDDLFLYVQDVITEDNIHVYYEFMSDEDLYLYKTLLTFKFDARDTVLVSHFKSNINFNHCIVSNLKNGYCLGISYFGVKDTLKPINDYIEEIKASKEYIAYMHGLSHV